MRSIKTLVPAVALAGLVSVSLLAQQPAPAPPSPTPQSAPGQPDPGMQQPSPSARPDTGASTPAPSAQPQDSSRGVPAPSTDATPPQLRPVTGELEKKLDSKNAKAGDPVVVKTTQDATTAAGTVIPKGSRIIGHVTEAQAHDKTNENARLTLEFDQAQLKNGQTLPITTVLEGVSPAEVNVHPTDTLNAQPSGMAEPGGGTASAPATGASKGTSTGATPSGGAQSAPSAGSQPTMTAGTQEQAASAAPQTGAIVARQGNVAIKTTAVPGVLLATNADGKPFSNAAGALLGAKQNVHLDGGTEIVLAVAEKQGAGNRE